jgi:hypothetical protein
MYFEALVTLLKLILLLSRFDGNWNCPLVGRNARPTLNDQFFDNVGQRQSSHECS